jgi:hypothetical protein
MRIQKLSGRVMPEDIESQKARRQKLKRRKRAKLKYGGAD